MEGNDYPLESNYGPQSPLPVNVSGRHLPKRVTFNSERAYYPISRRTSFASTVSDAAERSVAIAPPYLNTRLASPLRLQGLDQYESLQSPTRLFLDDHSDSSDNEVTDIEYDSDTASSLDSEDKNRKEVKVLPEVPNAQVISVGSRHHVKSSQFLNYGDEDTDCKIELKTSQIENTQDRMDVFRWIHLEEEVMDFANFTESAIQALELTVNERRMVKTKLQSVQKRYEKSFFAQYATRGRNLEPFVHQEVRLEQSAAQSYLDRKITIVCFPFFLLEDHIKRVHLKSLTNHPPLTLLQSVVPSTDPERDMRQVVCRSTAGQHRRCFYVGQLWALILDDSQMITCARLPEQELGGDVVTIVREPARDSPDGPFIKVTDGGNCIWRLRVADCMTWFHFTANFMEINSSLTDIVRRFEDIFKVTMKGRLITSQDWARVVKQAQQSSVHLVLSKRTRTGKVQSATKPFEDDDLSVSESDKVFPWQMDEMPPAPDTTHSLYVDGINIHDLTPPNPETAARDFATKGNRDAIPDALPILEEQVNPSPEDTDRQSTSSYASLDNDNGRFHALLYLNTPQDNPSHTSDQNADNRAALEEGRLSALLAGLDNKLLHNTPEHEKKAYSICRFKTLQETTRYLLTITRDGDRDEQSLEGYSSGLSTLDTFFMDAVQIFELFLPLENDSAIAKKYWGAIYFMLKNVLASPDPLAPRDSSRSTQAFARLAYLASIFRKELCRPQGPDFGTLNVPTEFRKAWMHCVRYLMLFRYKDKFTKERERHLEKCEALLDRGRVRLWRAAAKEPLFRKEVAPPLAVIVAIISNLTKDVTRHGSVVDIAQIYSQYWKNLETEAKAGRIRTTQQDIINLQQEISASRKNLHHQLDTLTNLYDAVEEQSKGWSEFNSRQLDHAPRIELPMLSDCIEHVKNRLKVFNDIDLESGKLEIWIKEQVALTKNRQENAIYAFTIVTVVFLPLSFVCSFLGMNTAGIRDMDNGQWVFWVSALPLTFIVIILALLLTDELGHVWKVTRQFLLPKDEFEGFSQTNRKSYLKIHDEKNTSWRDMLRPRTLPKQQSLIAVNEPTPAIQASAVDPWDRPYRRTQTFRSID